MSIIDRWEKDEYNDEDFKETKKTENDNDKEPKE